MRCVVPNCNNEASQGITYHTFPTERSLRATWLEALHLTDWEPEEHSVVCSCHFQRKDLVVSSNGERTVRTGAVPVIELLACRICFATDCKLYPMMAYKILSMSYETLTGLLIETEDKIPPYVCSECARRLLNYARFRTMSLGAHSILLEFVKNHGYITLQLLQSVKGIQCPLSLNQTDHNLDIELTQKENLYSDKEAACRYLTGIKTENDDMMNRDILNRKENLITDEQVGTWDLPGSHKDVAVDGIKVENDDMTNQNSSSEEENMYMEEHGDGGHVPDRCVDATDNITPENYPGIHHYSTNEDPFVGEDYSSDDSRPLAEASQGARPRSTGGAYQADSELTLSTHVKTHAATVSYSCNVCSYITVDKNSLKYHAKTHSSEKLYSCDICNEQFYVQDDLTKHMRLHSDVKNYSCKVCNKGFKNKSYIRKHLRTHTGEKPYSCEVCHKVFSQKTYLTVHSKTHSGVKPYSCHVCHKTFSVKTNLTKHIRVHTGEKPYSCDLCDKVFNQKTILKVHLRTHSGVKPYSCDVCNQVFGYKSNLTNHMRIHTGEKPYSCNVCNKVFNQNANLRVHLRTHSGVKPYFCSACNKTFSLKAHLKVHLKTHSVEKPYSCNTCNKTFKYKSTLAVHLRTHSSCGV